MVHGSRRERHEVKIPGNAYKTRLCCGSQTAGFCNRTRMAALKDQAFEQSQPGAAVPHEFRWGRQPIRGQICRSFIAVKIIYYLFMGKNLKPLWPYLSKYRVTLFWGAITVLFNNGLWVLWPQVVRRAVDDLNHHGITHQKILIFAALLVGLALGKGVFQFLTRWLVIGVSREIEYDLRNDMFRHLESLSYSYYQKNRTGDIMARATNDLNAVRMLLGPAIMYTANTLVFTAVALVFMWQISPKLTLYAFAPLPIASIVVQYIGRRIHERFEKIQAQFSDISARAQENFSGARVVRAYAQEEAEIALFETSNQEYVTRSLPLARLTGMLWPTLELLLGFALVLVLWLGGREVLLHKISLGDFVAFNTYIMMLTWPIIALGWVINHLPAWNRFNGPHQ